MGFLGLEDGQLFEGRLIGSKRKAIGEIVFNTGMTGYEEILSDPSYFGQMVLMTYPLIGNYGVNLEDMESSKPHIKALVVRELCDFPSNWRSEQDLNSWLVKHNIPGIQGVDTRHITKIIKEKGVMNAIISEDKPTKEDWDKVKAYKIKEPVKKVSVKKAYKIDGSGKNVAVVDLGVKRNILNCLIERNLNLTVFPYDVEPSEILYGGFHGVVFTNGPGNPKDNKEIIENIKALIGKKPIMGICLGHQLVALAQGADAQRLKYGHRGGNHPVKDLKSGKMHITAQNHSYAVIVETLPKNSKVTFINWHDKTVEGVKYSNNCFTVQFYPEANDTGYLYDEFLRMM
ncbi:MAG: carbamoyl phosphate synthase small subunit [Christensenellales bacterium]